MHRPRWTALLPVALTVALAMVAGCGGAPEKRACMGGATPSSLVSGAALFRLEIYDANATCAGSTVAAGAGLPLVSHVYGRNESISLDVPPGNHAMVLTTFADAAATQPLGQGCIVADLAAGSQICFDLTVDAYRALHDDLGAPADGGSDGGVPADLAGADLAGPPPDMSSPCTHVTTNFVTDGLPSPWTVENSARLDTSTGKGVIINSAVSTIGGLFYNLPLQTTSFDATFKYRIAGPDGIALVLANQAAGFQQNLQSGAGGGMGYVGMVGYAFELDVWQNAGDPNNNHVGYTHAFDGTHIVTGNPSVALDCNGCERTAHVRLTPTHLKFDIDGVPAFDGDLQASGPDAFVAGGYYFGFTASVGNVSGPPSFLHSISSVDLIVGPAGTCF
jgi:hypothetical protein